jgi:4a-hydroxytetrahydrobiopterin dehydratase
MTDQITPKQFQEAPGAADWRVLGDGACTYFRTGSFAAGARLAHAISQLPGVEDHHPDVDLRRDGVTVRLVTVSEDYYGMTRRDIELARRISATARELGRRPDGGPEPARHPGRDRSGGGHAVLAGRARL